MNQVPMVEPMVHLHEVELILKSDAGEINILRGVDLSVSKSESIGVVGPSGSGKTSMIMVIAGLEQVSSGQVFVSGREISTLNEDALAEFRRDHIGIVFQSFHLIPTMTAHENVAVPMELAGRDDAFQLAGEALDEVGLGTRLRHYPGQLSGGEQQRVALARAFAAEPRLLLADEPTGNLDGDTGARVVDLMFGMAERSGTTLMLITHDPAIAQRCDRVVRMVDGRVEEQAPFSQASTA